MLADVGGTNARFALFRDGAAGPVTHLAVADFPTFDDALRRFLAVAGIDRPAAAIIAVAGPVSDGRVRFTNSPWTLDAGTLATTFGMALARVVNDFEALAWSLPALPAESLSPLGGTQALAGAPMAVLGPGTGLGVACLLPDPVRPRVIASEGGHVSAPSWCERMDGVIAVLRRRFGHVSVERLLSGQGLENLYAALGALGGHPLPPRHAADITAAALDGSCPVAREAVDLFCALLGEVAGNFALSYGARGGVYIAGGIAPRIAPLLAASDFRHRFEAKGRFQAYLAPVPCHLVLHPEPTFVGLAAIAAALQSGALGRNALRVEAC